MDRLECCAGILDTDRVYFTYIANSYLTVNGSQKIPYASPAADNEVYLHVANTLTGIYLGGSVMDLLLWVAAHYFGGTGSLAFSLPALSLLKLRNVIL